MAPTVVPHPLDLDRLTPSARRLADAVFCWRPELAAIASMEGGTEIEPWRLFVEIESPTRDAGRCMVVYLVDDEPTLDFGGWHAHESQLDGLWLPASFVELLAAIVTDELVLVEEVDRHGQPLAVQRVLRRSDADGLLDELTFPGSSGRVRVISWTGAHDRALDVPNHDRVRP